MHFQDHIHEKRLALGNLHAVHGYGAIAVGRNRLAHAHRQRVSALGERAVFAFDLFEVDRFLQQCEFRHFGYLLHTVR